MPNPLDEAIHKGVFIRKGVQKAVEEKIFLVRNQRVMLDRDLAVLCGVSTKVLNQAVKRNKNRFPSDFMFRLTKKERDELVTICDRLETLKHSTAMPYAFTEQGVAMLSSVLKSERAVQVNISIMRVFVRIREMIGAHKDLALKLDRLEQKIAHHDHQIKTVFQAIRQLMIIPEKPKRKIGFH